MTLQLDANSLVLDCIASHSVDSGKILSALEQAAGPLA